METYRDFERAKSTRPGIDSDSGQKWGKDFNQLLLSLFLPMPIVGHYWSRQQIVNHLEQQGLGVGNNLLNILCCQERIATSDRRDEQLSSHSVANFV